MQSLCPLVRAAIQDCTPMPPPRLLPLGGDPWGPRPAPLPAPQPGCVTAPASPPSAEQSISRRQPFSHARSQLNLPLASLTHRHL